MDGVQMIAFRVDGQPIPKARPRLGKGHAYTPAKTIRWETHVGRAARMAQVEPFMGDVAIRLVFQRKGHTRADLDNLCKSLLDGLNGIAYADDKQVIRLQASIEYGSKFPGVIVELEEA